MHRFGIEDEPWFEAARSGLEQRGFKLRVQPRSIIIDKEGRLPRIVGCAREFLDFAERQGLMSDPGALEASTLYGDAHADVAGRVSESPFEMPVSGFVSSMPDTGYVESGFAAGLFGRGGAFFNSAAEARRPEQSAVEARLGEIRLDQERLAAERRAAHLLEQDKKHLEARLACVEAELARMAVAVSEAAKQRDLYQMSAAAAEDRLRALQAEVNTPTGLQGADKRFDQLRRFLARELHPDLSGEDAVERALREAIFKRVWAKIEQIQ